jgi:hypothetical protein
MTSAVHKGKKLSAEHKAGIIAAHKGKQHSVEHRAKISAALLGKPQPWQRDELNSRWKGDDARPRTIHTEAERRRWFVAIGRLELRGEETA